jgi:hypothetical protein
MKKVKRVAAKKAPKTPYQEALDKAVYLTRIVRAANQAQEFLATVLETYGMHLVRESAQDGARLSMRVVPPIYYAEFLVNPRIFELVELLRREEQDRRKPAKTRGRK